MSMSQPCLDLPDQRIAYADVRSAEADAVPLVLLHGGSSDAQIPPTPPLRSGR